MQRQLAGFAASALTVLAMTAGSSTPGGAQTVLPNLSVTRVARAPQLKRIALFAGTPCARAGQLLYVSDALDNTVNIYALVGSVRQNQDACGQITGFSLPQGIAVDRRGNLYVADTSNSRIVKFAPGKVTPSQIFEDPGQYPVGVAVDTSGVVAVTNITTVGPGTGSISVFRPNGTAIGTFHDAKAPREYFPKFDAAGDIFTSYSNADATLGSVNEYTAASGYRRVREFSNITVHNPGGIDIIGSTLFVGDASGVVGNSLDTPVVFAYKHGLGKGTAFALNQATFAPTFEFGASNGRLPLYAASAATAQAQEYLFGQSNDVASFLVVENESQPVGIAVTRNF